MDLKTRANTPRAPGLSELLAADLALRATQGPGVPPRLLNLGLLV